MPIQSMTAEQDRAALAEIEDLRARLKVAHRDLTTATHKSGTATGDIGLKIELGQKRQVAKTVVDELERELRMRMEAYEADQVYAPVQRTLPATTTQVLPTSAAVMRHALRRILAEREEETAKYRDALAALEAGKLLPPGVLVRTTLKDRIAAQHELGVAPSTLSRTERRGPGRQVPNSPPEPEPAPRRRVRINADTPSAA